VSYISENSATLPYIRLRGKWLDEAGFGIGIRFKADILDDSIILRKTDE